MITGTLNIRYVTAHPNVFGQIGMHKQCRTQCKRRRTRCLIRVYAIYHSYIVLAIPTGSKMDIVKIIFLHVSRKHTYINLTPLNPTFI